MLAQVRLILLAAMCGEHVLMVGPPGTAKSEVCRRLGRWERRGGRGVGGWAGGRGGEEEGDVKRGTIPSLIEPCLPLELPILCFLDPPCRLVVGRYFERLLTRFTVPEELFGLLSMRALEEDQ